MQGWRLKGCTLFFWLANPRSCIVPRLLSMQPGQHFQQNG